MDVLKSLTPKNTMLFYELCQILYFYTVYAVHDDFFITILVDQFTIDLVLFHLTAVDMF